MTKRSRERERRDKEENERVYAVSNESFIMVLTIASMSCGSGLPVQL